MMSFIDLSISFWGYGLETAAHILNKVPSKSVSSTPYELWNGKRPSLKYLKIWGCYAYVKNNFGHKLSAKADKCRFVGYPKEGIGYLFYNITEQKVFVSRHSTFLEQEFIQERISDSSLELCEEQNQQPDKPPNEIP